MDTRPSSLFIFINQWLETTPPWNIQSRSSKFETTFILIPHSAGVSKITKT